MALSEKQKKTAELLAKNFSTNIIAKRAGISKREIYKWRDNPEFQEYHNTIKRTLEEQFTELQLSNLSKDVEVQWLSLKHAQASELLIDASLELIKKYHDAITNLDGSDIKPSALSSGLKQAADALKIANDLYEHRLGLDRVIGEIEGIKDIGGRLVREGINTYVKEREIINEELEDEDYDEDSDDEN